MIEISEIFVNMQFKDNCLHTYSRGVELFHVISKHVLFLGCTGIPSNTKNRLKYFST